MPPVLISLITLLSGLVLLIGGGALLVRGACGIATALGISPLVVGMTIVGFGTSAPELAVNAISAVGGATGLAFGNVVGSNIANLSLVLGASAVMRPILIQGQLVMREIPLLLLVSTIVVMLASDGLLRDSYAMIDRADSLVLLCLFLIFLYVNVLDLVSAKRKDPLASDVESNPLVITEAAGRFHWIAVMVGIALLTAGGKLSVDGALNLAPALGLPEVTVGLLVIAVGTSMPELVTSVIAAMRKESDLALGNVVGSNLFNSMVVLPVTGLIAPISVPRGGVTDLAVSWALTVLLIPVFFLGKARLGRNSGFVLLLAYIGYLAYRIAASTASAGV